MHDEASRVSLLKRIEADRGHRTTHGRSEIAGPWDIVRLDLDDRTDDYVGEELYKTSGFGTGVTLESADYLLRFSPERVVRRLAPRPLLIVHGEQNKLHGLAEAQALYDAAAEPKRLEILPGCGHTEWMFDDHPTFKHVVVLLKEFLDSALGSA
ncbi:MAG TPA: alpha/beta hydrolase [Streptosporangiaceae bacterium]|nr:alpha/beta hydrolase [Streptosporangiaceae bacterium]